MDFYHLLEHRCLFSEAFFSDKTQGEKWGEQQKELLLQSKADEVMGNIEALPASKTKQKSKTKLLAYLKSNHDRMDYQGYQSIGCGIIGSGAVESATVLWCRKE
ncbi:MAG: hypothetical protein M3342_07160 [Bacteroidota bacterium]|nr:hypothetical protein [Flavisolibacter sp.]MDQ3843777.1 hypothetical protein [Bacteroidota bacterium]